ncbi:hypothetical protein ABPG75_012806 [Micractinium tetrahymenae]
MASLVQQMAAAGTTPGPASQPLPGPPRLLSTLHSCSQAASAPQQPRRRALQCQAAAPRAFGGAPEPGRQQPPSALASRAAAAADVLPAAVCLGEAPPIAEQLVQLQQLLARLGRAATYGEKVEVLMNVPAVQAFFSRTREGRLVAREWSDLSAKEAYCLACLPALHQEHVLALIPTGVPVTSALAQLAGALARVEDFYDSIGGLVGYQAQCVALIAQAQQEGQGPTPASSSVSSGEASTVSSDEAWPPGFAAAGGEEPPSGSSSTEFLVPVGLDLASPAAAQEAAAAVAAGLAALPRMAEIYPLGGAGDRLGLRCEATGESLPTAVLQYCGRSLLENLVRDVQAREYLYWKLHGAQHTTPIAIMTSAAKGNHWRVEALFEQAAWFGRGPSSFRLFQQPLVPMVAAHDGRWLLQSPLQPMMKPGGHGVIWKLMIDTGVFDWLAAQGREAAIVRQISNPMAGTDNTLLALAGAGFPGRRSFGFASCERVVGAAEGMNVLAQERRPAGEDGASSPLGPGNSSSGGGGGGGGSGGTAAPADNDQQHQRYRYWYRVTNMEYTEFERLGIVDSSVDDASNHSVFPANTNVLYVGLPAVERTVRASMAAGTTEAVLPGMILNLGKRVSWADPLAGGAERSAAAGRLECTMQNLADCLAQSFPAPLESGEDKAGLDTFLVYNQRRKVTSSAKRKLKPGSTRVHQTPDGSFLDLQRNAADMLASHCGMQVPQVGSVADYLERGPGFVFLAHPALGPLWRVVGQKIRGGSLAPRSEVQLEVAEACLRDVHVAGSLRVLAGAPLGHTEERAAPAGGAAADGRRRRSSLLEALLAPGANSSLGGLNGVEPLGGGSSGSAAVVEAGDDGTWSSYSQPCTLAEAPTACMPRGAERRLVFSQRCGRLRLHNVRVANAGADWGHPDNVWWRHSLVRREACTILLHGMSEFEARDVTLPGDLTFEVPDGCRMRVTAGPDGELRTRLEPLLGPSWRWDYSLSPAGEVALQLLELGGGSPKVPGSGGSGDDGGSEGFALGL